MPQIGRSFPSHNIAKSTLVPASVTTGSGGATAKKAVASATGIEEFTGSGGATHKKITASGAGTNFYGSGNSNTKKITVTSTGVEQFLGSGGSRTKKPSASATGTNFYGSGGISTKKPAVASTAVETFTGSGGAQAKKPVATGLPAAIRYNTGTTGSLDSVAHTSNFTFTVPSGVQVGDVMVVVVEAFTWTSSSPAFSTPTSGGGSWTPAIGIQASGAASGLDAYGQVFTRVATASDPGSTFTVSWTGTIGASDQFWWDAAMASYSGVEPFVPVESIAAVNWAGPTLVLSLPSFTTTHDNDYVIYCGGGGVNAGSIINSPGTQRQSVVASSGIGAALFDSNGSVGPTGTSVGGGNFYSSAGSTQWLNAFTVVLTPASDSLPANTGNARVKKTKATGKGILNETFSASFVSTDASGIDTWNITASGNDNGTGAHPTRVLKPTSPAAAYPHSFVFLLPVDVDQSTAFNDPIQIAHDQGWHNQYNITFVWPGYAIQPWYGDNDTDHTILQERFTLDVVNWAQANLASSGHEKNYILGFSKSGTGGAQLIFRNPTVFDAAILWDFPADWTNVTRFDPGTSAVFGDQANFDAYSLKLSNLTAWIAGSDFTTRNRLWLGGFSIYGSEVDNFDVKLNYLSALHTYTYKVSETHTFNATWMGAGLAAVIPSGNGFPSTKKPSASGTGTVTFNPTGSGGATAKKAVVASSGTEQFLGTGGATHKKPTASGAGTNFNGSGGATLKKPSASSTGTEQFASTGNATAKKISVSASGVIGGSAGTANIIHKKLSTTSTGIEEFSGSGSPRDKKPASAGTGVETFTGSGGASCKKTVASGTGFMPLPASGSGGSLTKKPAASVTGTETFTGTGALTHKKIVTSGIGSVGDISGSGGVTLKKSRTPATAGIETYLAAGAGNVKKIVGIGSGTQQFSGTGTLRLKKFIPIGISNVFGLSSTSSKIPDSIKLSGAETDSASVRGTGMASSSTSGRG